MSIKKNKKEDEDDYLPTKEEVRVNNIKKLIVEGSILWIIIALAVFFVQGMFVAGVVVVLLASLELLLLLQKNYPKFEEMLLKIFNFPAMIIMSIGL